MYIDEDKIIFNYIQEPYVIYESVFHSI